MYLVPLKIGSKLPNLSVWGCGSSFPKELVFDIAALVGTVNRN